MAVSPRPAWRALLLALPLLGGVSVAGAAGVAGVGGKLYCCSDATGKQVCGDILPQECIGHAYRELGDNGRTVRNVEAPLTRAQRLEREAEEERRKVEEAALREQQRKDQALLNTYGDVRDIDAMRERALADLQKSIGAAEAKIEEIRAQRVKYQNEAEFYKKKKMPPELQKGLADSDAEIKAQQSVIEAKRKEMGAVNEKYDDDKRRYVELARRPMQSR